MVKKTSNKKETLKELQPLEQKMFKEPVKYGWYVGLIFGILVNTFLMLILTFVYYQRYKHYMSQHYKVNLNNVYQFCMSTFYGILVAWAIKYLIFVL